MYISRVEIDSQNRIRIRDLAHLGAYHNWVESSFPEEIKDHSRSRKLWRIDTLQNRRYLLLVSEKQPDIELLERYGVPGSAETKLYDHFLDSIDNGKLYRFRVTFNPVIAISQGIGKRGKVVPEITAEQQMNYLESRAEKLGFELIPGKYAITERGWEPLGKQGQRMIRLSKATCEGMLKVTDSEVFCHTLVNGIGKKKAYGFGLMTVIPVQEIIR